MKTTQPKIAQISALQSEVGRLHQQIAELREKSATELREATERNGMLIERACVAESLAKDARASINRLKEKLHSALMEGARLRGYIERSLEDDKVRELGPSVQNAPVPLSPPPISRRKHPWKTQEPDTFAFEDRRSGRSSEREVEWFAL